MTEALLLWEEREMRCADFLASLDAVEADLDWGGGILIDATSMKSMAEDANGWWRSASVRSDGPSPWSEGA